MIGGPELEYVENPFLDQLNSMGWKVVIGSVDHPSVTGRDSFREVLIKGDLAKALLRNNLRDGKPWLDAARISQDLGYRWGSCGKGGRLFFHFRTVLLPPPIIEYVVVHELVHLVEPHHNPAFWARVERAMPDFADRKQWLAEKGGASCAF